MRRKIGFIFIEHNVYMFCQSKNDNLSLVCRTQIVHKILDGLKKQEDNIPENLCYIMKISFGYIVDLFIYTKLGFSTLRIVKL